MLSSQVSLTDLGSVPRSVGNYQVLRAVFWLIGIVIGLLQAWHDRNMIVIDTISHLDMADGYFWGDWAIAINGSWDPLYALVLGLGGVVVKTHSCLVVRTH